MHSEKFRHNNINYEVRVICDGETVYVKAFQNSRPANKFKYSALVDVIQDVTDIIGTKTVNHLVRMAKQDVIDGLE